MCRQVIKSCNDERLLPGLAQPRALIRAGNARILRPLTAALSRGAGGGAQGRKEPSCEGSGSRTRLSQTAAADERSHGIPGTRQGPPGPSGTLSPGSIAAPEPSAACAATPGRGLALSTGRKARWEL